MRRLYNENAEAFVRRFLIPVDIKSGGQEPFSRDLPSQEFAEPEKGFFTLTTR